MTHSTDSVHTLIAVAATKLALERPELGQHCIERCATRLRGLLDAHRVQLSEVVDAGWMPSRSSLSIWLRTGDVDVVVKAPLTTTQRSLEVAALEAWSRFGLTPSVYEPLTSDTDGTIATTRILGEPIYRLPADGSLQSDVEGWYARLWRSCRHRRVPRAALTPKRTLQEWTSWIPTFRRTALQEAGCRRVTELLPECSRPVIAHADPSRSNFVADEKGRLWAVDPLPVMLPPEVIIVRSPPSLP